jgi:hypothetical protein
MPAQFDDNLLIWPAGTLHMRTLCASHVGQADQK